MAYKVRLTLTRASASTNFQAQDDSFITQTESLMSANNVTAERTISGNVLTVVYTAPTEADYDNFYDAMVPRWGSIGAVAYNDANGITYSSEVIENT